jgi:hypothetical protein
MDEFVRVQRQPHSGDERQGGDRRTHRGEREQKQDRRDGLVAAHPRPLFDPDPNRGVGHPVERAPAAEGSQRSSGDSTSLGSPARR